MGRTGLGAGRCQAALSGGQYMYHSSRAAASAGAAAAAALFLPDQLIAARAARNSLSLFRVAFSDRTPEQISQRD
jgi:hypothetical protein